MGPKPFSKAWRQALINDYSKARVVCYGKYPTPRYGVNPVSFDPVARQVARLT